MKRQHRTVQRRTWLLLLPVLAVVLALALLWSVGEPVGTAWPDGLASAPGGT